MKFSHEEMDDERTYQQDGIVQPQVAVPRSKIKSGSPKIGTGEGENGGRSARYLATCGCTDAIGKTGAR